MTQHTTGKRQEAADLIVSEYIAGHGVTEINDPILFKAIIRQIIKAIPAHVSNENIKIQFEEALLTTTRR